MWVKSIWPHDPSSDLRKPFEAGPITCPFTTLRGYMVCRKYFSKGISRGFWYCHMLHYSFKPQFSYYNFWLVWVKMRNNITQDQNQSSIWPSFCFRPLLFSQNKSTSLCCHSKVRSVVSPSSELDTSLRVKRNIWILCR